MLLRNTRKFSTKRNVLHRSCSLYGKWSLLRRKPLLSERNSCFQITFRYLPKNLKCWSSRRRLLPFRALTIITSVRSSNRKSSCLMNVRLRLPLRNQKVCPVWLTAAWSLISVRKKSDIPKNVSAKLPMPLKLKKQNCMTLKLRLRIS